MIRKWQKYSLNLLQGARFKFENPIARLQAIARIDFMPESESAPDCPIEQGARLPESIGVARIARLVAAARLPESMKTPDCPIEVICAIARFNRFVRFVVNQAPLQKFDDKVKMSDSTALPESKMTYVYPRCS